MFKTHQQVIKSIFSTKKFLALFVIMFTSACSNATPDEGNSYNISSNAAPNEGDFYKNYSKNGVYRQFQGNGQDTNNDTPALQSLINDLTQLPNGGSIFIPAGTWYIGELRLKSNTHLIFDKNATVRPFINPTGNPAIFNLGENGSAVENVSIRGSGGRFKVDLNNQVNKNIIPFKLLNVKNFMLSDIHVKDDFTVHSAANFNFSWYQSKIYGPENGLVKNFSNENGHGGYGLIQVRIGKNIFFKNLDSYSGGATLRIETDPHAVHHVHNQASPKLGAFDIVARDITCKNGNSAVMLQPWDIDNGILDIANVSANSCKFAVRVDRAYVDPTNDNIDPNQRIGSFDPRTTISNITATYGLNSQIKNGSFPFVPQILEDEISTTPFAFNPNWFKGPSLAPVLYAAKGSSNDPRFYEVNIENITAHGFLYVPNIVTWDDRFNL
ncbi:hypothetical protein C2869_05000 [Saccharobesus litoralis]|uniref:Pectate lyase superfamily protein domain-containing protein n=1 Tax=Saccharobesus litoralis TaxID=2172099 RepID=A0A2S0VNN8_9ALTE|nr:hypothetical protein [Saccharobesus litoralis]AWB65837.1 hypothetical protein C2869_05000 [Saccharobesus litoralis]